MIDINLIPAPVIQIKFNGTIICANQQAETIFMKKLAGKSIVNFIKPLGKGIIDGISDVQHVQIEAKIKNEYYLFTLKKDPISRSIIIVGSQITDLKMTQQIKLKRQKEKLEKKVRLGTRELENITKEMENTHMALTYLIEDVNEAREEIEESNMMLISEIKSRMLKEQELEARTQELNLSLLEEENARNKIDGILKSIADGIIVTDMEKNIVLINKVSREVFDVTPTEVRNKSIEMVIKDRKIYEKFNIPQSELENGYDFDFELSASWEKNPRIYNAVMSNIRNNKGEPVGIITVFRDVSHQKELDNMKTEFISTTAHELRTPLTSIQGFAEILLTRDSLKPFEEKKYLNYILNQAKRLGRIINNLLDISRIESGRGIILQKEPCFLGEMIRRIVSNFASRSRGYTIIVDIKEESTDLLADNEKIEQVVVNLLANALNYSQKGSKIKVNAKRMKDQYQVTIEDQGIGMTPEQVERVFEKFYRAETSNTAVEGTGLGMSIVKNNIDAHGGKVWVESKYHAGTKVTFTLPIIMDQEKQEDSNEKNLGC